MPEYTVEAKVKFIVIAEAPSKASEALFDLFDVKLGERVWLDIVQSARTTGEA